ncbi:SRS domain-containing protein [Neospora caninum Liverpool]|uniref:SRS domain-containing protein n=1 Tax=Neospora caninum (strain Liverpool) TaxID=572307 RepID=F0VL94_NEOCL|nr:SRS domain-containing protein [Neospora caninum Liverpool]CBZ54846.1 SRS domain-containing protein [Neospora caninum Liverpool]CEL69565.1 TPA: SRS domain-containing protein [Neospora caninum Liverpool]|eukprot:XP_003884874.1 SRS domain-containing protein [Neospora caninum Liverpool]
MRRLLYFEDVFPFCLAILLAGGFLEPIFSQESGDISSSTGQPQTCDSQERGPGSLASNLDLTLSPDSDSISFKCSSTQKTTIAPEKEQVFTNPACSRPVTLTSLFTGAKLAEDGSEEGKKTYTLTIPNDSRKATEQELFYKCTVQADDSDKKVSVYTSAQAGTECTVKITVAGVKKEPAPEHGDEQQTTIIECASTEATKEASVSAESPLSFRCGTGLTLQPEALTNAFDGQDGACATEVALQTLVDATLKKTETNGADAVKPVYQLAVQTTPSVDTAFCYKCAPASGNSDSRTTSAEGSTEGTCLLKVSVKGSASSASARRKAAQGGVAMFVAAQILLGLQFALV